LLAKIGPEGSAVEVAKRLYKRVDGKMGASETGIAINFQNTDGNGNSRQIRGARDETFTQESGR
jgi:hypothetical protein